MESALLGLMLDSSIVIEAERRSVTVQALLEQIRTTYGEVDVAICAITVAELAHGVYRATQQSIREQRRQFIDELKRHVPVLPITEATGELIGKLSGESAAGGVRIPFEDLAIGAAALELGFGVATKNVRHFQMIPKLVVKPF